MKETISCSLFYKWAFVSTMKVVYDFYEHSHYYGVLVQSKN
jgi:hypothetical protein